MKEDKSGPNRDAWCPWSDQPLIPQSHTVARPCARSSLAVFQHIDHAVHFRMADSLYITRKCLLMTFCHALGINCSPRYMTSSTLFISEKKVYGGGHCSNNPPPPLASVQQLCAHSVGCPPVRQRGFPYPDLLGKLYKIAEQLAHCGLRRQNPAVPKAPFSC